MLSLDRSVGTPRRRCRKQANVLRHAIGRTSDGTAARPLGKLLDLLAMKERQRAGQHAFLIEVTLREAWLLSGSACLFPILRRVGLSLNAAVFPSETRRLADIVLRLWIGGACAAFRACFPN